MLASEPGTYGRKGLSNELLREPIPYHTICREMFRKGKW
jgi:hypothetical protein